MGAERPKPWLDDIRGSDAHALIESDEPLIRVNAGPGTGKTTCLRRRAQRLIEGDGVDPKTVFVGTFTRAIANELKRELGEAITVSTLHSHAYQLLRRHPEARQGMELRFLLSFEEDAMLYDINHELKIFPDLWCCSKRAAPITGKPCTPHRLHRCTIQRCRHPVASETPGNAHR